MALSCWDFMHFGIPEDFFDNRFGQFSQYLMIWNFITVICIYIYLITSSANLTWLNLYSFVVCFFNVFFNTQRQETKQHISEISSTNGI